MATDADALVDKNCHKDELPVVMTTVSPWLISLLYALVARVTISHTVPITWYALVPTFILNSIVMGTIWFMSLATILCHLQVVLTEQK